MEKVDGPEGLLSIYHRPGSKGKMAILFLHGNGTGYDASVDVTRGFASAGHAIVIPEYPGYGGSPGTPSETSLKMTADLTYQWMLSKGFRAQDIVIFGNSIGTGPAVHIAKRPHRALVVVSGVASMTDVVRHHYPFVPISLLHDGFENDQAMRGVQGPLLVIHARDDQVVPYSHGVRLAKAGRGFLMSPETGGHGIVFEKHISNDILGWLAELPN